MTLFTHKLLDLDTLLLPDRGQSALLNEFRVSLLLSSSLFSLEARPACEL